MTPERWQQVKEIFHSVLQHDPSQRSAFLSDACAGDQSLRNEVELLIDSHEKDGSFIDSSADKAAAEMLDQELKARQTIGHYEILSTLGKGGMGEVYLARDTRLDRKVALKFLSVAFTTNQDRLRRFEQEARAASALNHPNILTIYEIGQVSQTNFIATEFVEGETLRQRMNSPGLTLRETLDVGAQILAALDAAHEAHIIHRDIKPDNIMIRRRDGIVKVLDFGLAKLMEKPTTGQIVNSQLATKLLVRTEVGMVMGTAHYMSPEQARGQQVDERTDIWSIGVVLYETMAGAIPFGGETAEDVRASILKDDLPPLSTRIPERVRALVETALRKDREERYQTIAEMLADLRLLQNDSAGLEARTERFTLPESTAGEKEKASYSQHATKTAIKTVARTDGVSNAEYIANEIKRHRKGVLAAVAVLATFVVVASAVYFARSNRVADQPVDSIAVLPFVNVGNDPNTEYLSDGISDSIINRLSQLANLRVVSLSSALRYKGQQIDPPVVGRDLKVRAVLIGWMTKRGDDLSVRTELVDVRDNRRLWGEQYNNRQLANLLEVQEEIAREISDKLRLRLTSQERQRLTRHETQSSEAYQLYLQGRFYWNKFTEDGFHKSIEYFKQAVDKDPTYGLAYSGLAESYSLLGELSSAPPKETFPQGQIYAAKALKLDESLSEAHLSLGIVKLFYDWDVVGAERELRRAKELDPNNPQAYHFYGHYLQFAGRLDEAHNEFQQGVQLDPTNLILNAEFGWDDYIMRRYDVAIAQYRKTLELDPNFVLASVWIAQAYEQQGKYQEALAELKRAKAIDANWSWITAEIGCVDAFLGKRAEAQKIIQELHERTAHEYIDPTEIAYIYVALADKDQAFAILEKGYQERAGNIPWVKMEPKFDPLRGDARFIDLLRRIGLPS